MTKNNELRFIRVFTAFSLGLLIAFSAIADEVGVEVLAHYELGQGGSITYESAVPTLENLVQDGADLDRIGQPVIYADAPRREAVPQTSVLFREAGQRYEGADHIGRASDALFMEVWVKVQGQEALDTDGRLRGIVANGNGARGWVIGQIDDNWVMFIGAIGRVDIGRIVPDQWVHLAAVNIGGSGALFLNGERAGSFSVGGDFNDGFSIGTSGNPSESFEGLIHAVRVGRALPDFDIMRDTLLAGSDLAQIAQLRSEELRRYFMARVDNIIKEREGSRLVERINHPFVGQDWLVEPVNQAAEMQVHYDHEREIVLLSLGNGLISRTFLFSDNLACVSMRQLGNQAEFLRSIKPEARIKIDGQWHEIGGLTGQPENGYLLDAWFGDLRGRPDAFRFVSLELSEPQARYPWEHKYNAVPADWPPKGLRASMTYEAPENIDPRHSEITVTIHYEIYEGIPVMAKWLTLDNGSKESIAVEEIETEILAVAPDQIDRLHMESDYAFAIVNAHPDGSALMHYRADSVPDWAAPGSTTLWERDPEHTSWATHNQAEDLFLNFPHFSKVKSHIPLGPDEKIEAEGRFESHITFQLLQDSDDRVRRTLGHRRLYRILAPQVTENLLAAGITSQDEEQIKGFIDQMYELGFERLDIMAWPGINHVNLDPDYVAKWSRISEYACERGIIMGGYELWIASRGRGAHVDCIDPETGRRGSFFGNSVCLASEWYDSYTDRMWRFFDKTGFMVTNFDGPYHGDVCASTEHKYHRGLADSQWRQWQKQVGIIHEFQRRNFYAMLPDWYFLNGQTSTGMGYREATANLPPQQQLLLGRQYIYDGTWHKTPTMGWMTLQLVGFYSRDPRLGLEPLSENIDRYELGLIQHLGSGCQLTVRGDRLYDTPEVKEMVRKWVDWFKKYRGILTSDIIHLGRPTGRDLDAMMHANSQLNERAMVIVFNPTSNPIEREIELPLYYTGLTDTAMVREQEGESVRYELDREYSIRVPVNVAAGDFTWLVVESD